MKSKVLYLFILFCTLSHPVFSSDNIQETTDLRQVIPEYRKLLTTQPVDYFFLEKKQLTGVMLKKYQLNSQSWALHGDITPEGWQHEVDIYIPDHARETNALVVVNNGSNNDGKGTSIAPSNFTQEQLVQIATETNTIVISVSNVPNQKLTYRGANVPLAEDASVAWSWKLFLDDRKKNHNASLHIPMSTAVSQALRLAKKELAPEKITQFIVSGASKRGWAAWLAALSDPDVVAVVPFAMDLLNTQESLRHMYFSYGKNWPIAFHPYYQQEIDKYINSEAFSALMLIEDPLSYSTDRLKIDKYIINASGDDFYTPDNSRFYYEKLPGNKSLRVVGNSTHNGILSVTVPSLVTFINRFQEKKALPEIHETTLKDKPNHHSLKMAFSEQPTRLIQWTAYNPTARDFRFACDIKYYPTPVSLPTDSKEVILPLAPPENGWQATYFEATFRDDYVATSQVYIMPDTYPTHAPESKGAACQTLPGRGLLPTQ